MFNVFKSCVVYEVSGKVRQSQAHHEWQYNMMHALWMPHNEGCRHTLSAWNTYCLSTTPIVTRTQQGITFLRTLRVLLSVYCGVLLTSVWLITNHIFERIAWVILQLSYWWWNCCLVLRNAVANILTLEFILSHVNSIHIPTSDN
jgi:hypothetical protein